MNFIDELVGKIFINRMVILCRRKNSLSKTIKFYSVLSPKSFISKYAKQMITQYRI